MRRQRVALGDALSVLIDHRGKTPKKLGGDWSLSGHRVVSAINIKDNRVDENDHHYVSPELYARWMREPLRADDVLLTSEAPTGEVAYLETDADWCLGQRLFGLRGKSGLLYGRYLFYALRGGDARNQLMARSTGTTVSGIRQSELVKLELDLPPFAEQLGIAETFGVLDAKIESNRRLQENALNLAENLYRKACERKSTAIDLGHVGRWLSGGTPRTSEPAYWGGDLPWISSSSMHDFFVSDSDRTLTAAGAEVAANVIPPGSIVFVVRGMSLKTKFRIGLTQRPVAFGQDCKAIVPSMSGAMLAVALRTLRDDILTLVDEAGHGTGRLQTDRLQRVRIVLPTDPEVPKTLEALLASGGKAARESRRLATLRDALLPELLSGRIRVPEAAEAVEAPA